MTLLDALQQFVKVGHGAELGHDFAIIANVVTVIGIRRVIVRAQPDDVDAETLYVIELRRDALQISDTVAVRVLERPGIHLIDDGFFPPLRFVAIKGRCAFHGSLGFAGWGRSTLAYERHISRR